LLSQCHGSLWGEAEFTGRLLLEPARNKRSHGIATLLFALDGLDRELFPPNRGDDALSLLGRWDDSLSIINAVKPGLKRRRVRAGQRGNDGPVFL